MNIDASNNERAQQERRLAELEEEKRRVQQQMAVQSFAASYPIQLDFPSQISAIRAATSDQSTSTLPSPSPRTDVDLIQMRLLEAGVMYEAPTTVGHVAAASQRFIADLQRTGNFENVQIQIQQSNSEENPQLLKVILDEKRWYRLHIGGGVKAFDDASSSNPAGVDSFLPTAELDVSVGLRNATGHLDKTDLQYTLDTHGHVTWSLLHEQPLYRFLPESLRYPLLETDRGSQYVLTAKALLDTVDHEYTRSYKEYQRVAQVRVCNTHSIGLPEASPLAYVGVDWTACWRDIVPKRHATIPFALDCSHRVAVATGPSLKHAIKAEWRSNGELTDRPLNPSRGLDYHASTEVALPPGDVGFCKLLVGIAAHMPLSDRISVHGLGNGGYLHALSWGGLCGPPTLSDRLFVGGPLQLRGFLPAGIGPKAKPGGSLTAGGADAIGGHAFWTGSVMASVAPPSNMPLIGELLNSTGTRVFGFINGGTLVGSPETTSLLAVAQSTRVAVGVGLATTAMGPRLETTYSWPIRYGPSDARKQWQFGVGFTYS